MKTEFRLALLFVSSILAAPSAIPSQAQAPAKQSCAVDDRPPSEADMARFQERYADAERLYNAALAADPAAVEAMAGLARTKIDENKVPEALALATQYNAAHPGNPELLRTLGDVRFRLGEITEATNAFNQSIRLDLCNGGTQYDMYRLLRFSGMGAAAQRRLDLAHSLSPNNQQIKLVWHQSHDVPMTDAERLVALKDRLQNPALAPDEKDAIKASINGIEASEKGDCELVAHVTDARLPIVPIAVRPGSILPEDMYAAGLDALVNGKRERLEINTAGSGLLVSRAAAKAAGLVPELDPATHDITDQGPSASYVTHVDDIHIGSMEFKNCMVRVLEPSHTLGNTDGFIGLDVFRNYLVTLDIPGREVRLGPLPPRPDEKAAQPTSLSTSDAGIRQTIADQARDRYTAPEMKDWIPVYRVGPLLILPTVVGNAPTKLFVLNSASSRGTISPEAAREVAHVSKSGSPFPNVEMPEVLIADKVSITFAGIHQTIERMLAFDNSAMTRYAGIEISGLIGFPTLRELVISIDYRDNLLHVVYDPTKGFHAH